MKNRCGNIPLQKRGIVITLRILDAVDFDQRIAAVLRVLLQIDDFIAINQKHLVGAFFARFLGLLFGSQLFCHGRDIFAFDHVSFCRILAFALHVDERILVFHVAACIAGASEHAAYDGYYDGGNDDVNDDIRPTLDG